MIPTIDQIAVIAGRTIAPGSKTYSNATSLLATLALVHDQNMNHLAEPNQLAQMLGQVLHESNCFLWDEELWGPTPQQRKYEPPSALAESLGNTGKGDGYRYRGRGAIQITGGSNYQTFTDWSQSQMDDAPDFYLNPDHVLSDPWEGMVVVWYWGTHGCIPAADKGSVEAVTRCVNGGTSGFKQREEYFVRTALVFCGYKPTSVVRFQADHGLKPDGIAGPETQKKLTELLKAMWPETEEAPAPDDATTVASAQQEALDKLKSLVVHLEHLIESFPKG